MFFNNYPRFQYITIAVESRIGALKPRTNFTLNFVRDSSAKESYNSTKLAILRRRLVRDLPAVELRQSAS
jgi:hypothetical protein